MGREQYFRRLMDRQGLTSYKAVAAAAGLSDRTVYVLVKGKCKNPRIHTVALFCDALCISLNDYYYH